MPTIELTEKIFDTLCKIAAEDELNSPADAVVQLIDEEDRRRHIERPPYQGEVRVQCGRKLCFETRLRPTALDIEEL